MIDDDYDDYEDAAPARTGWTVVVYRWLLGIGGAAALAFGGVYLHYHFSGGTAASQQGGVPLIRAAKGPVKVRPADPGGRDVPNKDLDVYKEFDAARLKRPPGTTSEDLLAPGKPRPAANRNPVPEGPVCHPVPTLLADTGRYRRAALKRASAKLAASKPATSTKAAPKTAASRPADSRKTVERRPIRSVPKAVKTIGKAGTGKANATAGKAGVAKPSGTARKAAKAGSFRIQLGAFRTRAKAANTGRGLQRRHQGLLGGLNMVVERVDLGARGIFYRLRAGPIANRQTARSLCRSLGKRRINCFLVSG